MFFCSFFNNNLIVIADPVIKKQIEHNEEHLKDTNIVYAQVGTREE